MTDPVPPYLDNYMVYNVVHSNLTLKHLLMIVVPIKMNIFVLLIPGIFVRWICVLSVKCWENQAECVAM